MLFHIIASLVLIAIGFGLGRIKNLKGAEAKIAADKAALSKVITAIKKL